MRGARTHHHLGLAGGAPSRPAHAVAWREPDEDPEIGPDRDARVMHYASVKGAGRERMAPMTPGGHRDTAWGGALRRVVDVGVGPSREDETRLGRIPGRHVPIGFARYVSSGVNPYDYGYYLVAGWRVAVPRGTPDVRGLLWRILYQGPQAAGYVRLGDTLVPAILGPGDRMTLSESAVKFEPQPLSP